ncbi:anaerobic C4-dicarboxylate transporter family protein [Vibrio sinaloensis]|nr:anaerobic C4-dicarboxylate transporter family protein [Vibrio sinaloensis]
MVLALVSPVVRGVIALSLVLGVPTSQAFIPIDVILIIMSVITAIAAMQVAGGMDWLVQVAENFFCASTLSASPFMRQL